LSPSCISFQKAQFAWRQHLFHAVQFLFQVFILVLQVPFWVSEPLVRRLGLFVCDELLEHIQILWMNLHIHSMSVSVLCSSLNILCIKPICRQADLPSIAGASFSITWNSSSNTFSLYCYLLGIPISCCQGSSYSSWGPNTLRYLNHAWNKR
jgi:hypothetical protein